MRIINNTEVNVINGSMEDDEIRQYINYLKNKYPGNNVSTLTLTIDNEDVDLNYVLTPVGFERIRRITGYLVGTVESFNNAKQAEEKDRVKHI